MKHITKFQATVYCDEYGVPVILQTNHAGLLRQGSAGSERFYCHECSATASSAMVNADGGYVQRVLCSKCATTWLKEQGLTP